MRNELNAMIQKIDDPDYKKVGPRASRVESKESVAASFCVPSFADSPRCFLRPQAFEAEMQSFFILFNRYLAERAKGQKMCVPSKASTPVASSTVDDREKGHLVDMLRPFQRTATGTRSSPLPRSRLSSTPTCPKSRTRPSSTSSPSSSSTVVSVPRWAASDPRVSSRSARA